MKLPSFKVRLPRLGASALASQWLLGLLAMSIVANFDGGFLASRLALIPSRVWLGEIWRTFTWPFIEPGVMTLLLTGAAIFKLGNELGVRWGDRRLQQFATRVVFGAGAITVLVSTLVGYGRVAHLGGWAVADLLVIGWARQFPLQPLVFYGIELHGRRLIQFTIGINVLFAIFTSPLHFAPELSACALAAWYPQAWLRR